MNPSTMISFIVIGKNEGWKLTKCFLSILETVRINKQTNYEVIYVDSKSTDDSILRAREVVNNIKIYQITGACNAAIGRNIGAKESRGDVLFFIDGDMEIVPDFLPLVYDSALGLKYPFVTGNLVNTNYSTSGDYVSQTQSKNSNIKDTYEIVTGGIFLIQKELWFILGGMKTKLVCNEDLDFGLRFTKMNNKILKKKEVIATHHTVPYNDKYRIWKIVFSKKQFFRAVLLRDNFNNINQWNYFVRGNYTFLLLLLLIILSVLFLFYLLILFYFVLIVIRTLFRKEFSLRLIITRVIYFTIYESFLLFAFVLFWPKSYNEEYIQIR